MQFKFRRNTHTPEGIYKEEFKDNRLTHLQRRVWQTHGHIVHMLYSGKPITFQELLDEIRKDEVNYWYGVDDTQDSFNGLNLPEPKDIAFGLIRLIEANFVEVVPSE
jgi:hypothetical protein